MSLLHLNDGRLRAAISPENGGGLVALDWLGRDEPVAVMRSAEQAVATALLPIDPNQLACYPLLPWSNRIAEGGFTFGGTHVALSPNRDDESFPIHGSGWQRSWRVERYDEHEVTLSLDEQAADGFDYHATMRYLLIDDGLAIELSIRNTGKATLPFGLGLHPFLPRHDGVELYAPTAKVWVNDGVTPLPVAHVDVPTAWDFRTPRALPQEGVNHAFGPWTGQATIRWPHRHLALQIDASADTFVMYTPASGDFFCFEPVDHPINAVHLPGGPAANGLTLLAPGQSLARRFVFRVVDGDADQA